MADLKPVYQAVSKDEAEFQLQELEGKWGKKYAVVIDSWYRNWSKLSTYFKYSPAIRKLIYTDRIIDTLVSNEILRCQYCRQVLIYIQIFSTLGLQQLVLY